jgi:hypothetical protein
LSQLNPLPGRDDGERFAAVAFDTVIAHDAVLIAFVARINGAFTKSSYVNHVTVPEWAGSADANLMSQMTLRSTNPRFCGLDIGDWSVLIGGFAMAALVLFLN